MNSCIRNYCLEDRYSGPIDPPYREQTKEEEIAESGNSALSFKVGGRIFYYRDQWEKIEDEHYKECPTAIAARKKTLSTVCECGHIEMAENSIKGEN